MKDRCTAIVLAAGQGQRMKSKVKKQFLSIAGKPIVYYALQCFEKTSFITNVILVEKIVVGGKERYDSVYAGLLACGETDYVYIHDGIRPFITRDILKRALDGARETGACVVGMPSKDTVKIVDKEQFVAKTPKRARVWAVQTPQVFRYSIIRRAHEKARLGRMDGVTDDSMLVEKYGDCKVKMVEGSYENLKITTMEDLFVAEVILRGNEL